MHKKTGCQHQSSGSIEEDGKKRAPNNSWMNNEEKRDWITDYLITFVSKSLFRIQLYEYGYMKGPIVTNTYVCKIGKAVMQSLNGLMGFSLFLISLLL